MKCKTKVDKYGRILLPKSIRDRLGLQAGTDIELGDTDDKIILSALRESSNLKEENGILVYTAEATGSDADFMNAVDASRDEYLKKLLQILAMKILMDTNVIISALVQAHPRHPQAIKWLEECCHGKHKLYVCDRSIAEAYVGLPNLPVSPRIPSTTAFALLKANLFNLAFIHNITAQDTINVIERLSTKCCHPTLM